LTIQNCLNIGVEVVDTSIVIINYLQVNANGQGFYVIGSDIQVLDSNITSNTNINTGYGGGFYLEDSGGIISNCNILRNSANYGSGIWLSNSNHSIAYTQVNSNVGNSIIFYNDSVSTLSNCRIQNNSVTGAVVYSYLSSPTITSCSFTNNNGTSATSVVHQWISCNSSTTLLDSTFVNNRGGVWLTYDSAAVIESCSFVRNWETLASDFSAVTIENSVATVVNSNITNNSFPNSPAGGLYAYSTNITVSGTNILGNSGNEAGGFFLLSGIGTVTGSYFHGNTAQQAGGGLNIENSTANFYSCIITYNTVTLGNGGGLFSTGSEVTISESSVVENTCGMNGGGLFFQDSPEANTTIFDTVVENNNAGNAGGGVYLANVMASFTSCSITYNTATLGNGGGLFSTDSEITISESSLADNTCGTNGGGVFFQDSPEVNTTIFDTIVANNNARTGGGGVYLANVMASFDNCSITYNTATLGNGGGLFSIGSEVTISGSSVAENTCERNGGGLFFQDSPQLNTTIFATVVENNNAANGGGVCLENVIASFESGSVTVNHASALGGGVLAVSSNVNLDAYTISHLSLSIFLSLSLSSLSFSQFLCFSQFVSVALFIFLYFLFLSFLSLSFPL
jgi:Right handed beta helix region